MNVEAVDPYLCAGGVEVLILYFAFAAPVNGVGKIRAEACNVKIICARADFLIGGKTDRKSAVRNVFS